MSTIETNLTEEQARKKKIMVLDTIAKGEKRHLFIIAIVENEYIKVTMGGSLTPKSEKLVITKMLITLKTFLERTDKEKSNFFKSIITE